MEINTIGLLASGTGLSSEKIVKVEPLILADDFFNPYLKKALSLHFFRFFSFSVAGSTGDSGKKVLMLPRDGDLV